MERVTFTCERQDGKLIEFGFDADGSASQLLEEMRSFMMAMAFSKKTVDEFIRFDGNEVIPWNEGYSGAQKYAINAGDVVIEEIRVKDGDATEFISDLTKLINKSVRKQRIYEING